MLFVFILCVLVSNTISKSDDVRVVTVIMMGASSGAGTVHLSRAPELTPGFLWGSFNQNEFQS